MTGGLRKFMCPFVGLDDCKSGGGTGLVRTSFLTHLKRHFNGDTAAKNKALLSRDHQLFNTTEATFSSLGIWLCGECFKTHTLTKKCDHGRGKGSVQAPDQGEGPTFFIHDVARPAPLGFSDDGLALTLPGEDHAQELFFDTRLMDKLLGGSLITVKSIPPTCRLGYSKILKNALDRITQKPSDISRWVQLFIMPILVLRVFNPRSNSENRSLCKKEKQLDSISNAIRRWAEPGGVQKLTMEALIENSMPYLRVEEEVNLEEANIKQCKRKLGDGHYTAAIKVLTSSGVAPRTVATLEELKTKHPIAPALTLPISPITGDALMATREVVLERIRSFPRGTSCGRDGLRAQHLLDILSGSAVAISDELVDSIVAVVNLFLKGSCPATLGEYVASAPLTPLVKPGGGIRPIAVGTVWRRLVSKVAAILVGKAMGFYLEDLQYGVGVQGGGEAVLHAVNRLVEDQSTNSNLTMLLVDFKNAFNLVSRDVMIREVRQHCPSIARWVEFCYSRPARLYYGDTVLWSCQGVQQGDPLGPLLFALVLHPLIQKIQGMFDLKMHAWYLDDGTIVGDTIHVGKALGVIMEEGPQFGLHLNVDKTEVFWPSEDPRSREAGVFPPGIVRPSRGVKLLGGPVSVDDDFCREIAVKRVNKTIELMEAISKLNDPQCELLLLRSCAGVARLYFAMRTCSPTVFDDAQVMFDKALRTSLERIVTASGPGYGDWQWRVSTLPIKLGGLGVFLARDVLHYAFVASRLQSTGLQAKLLRNTGVTGMGQMFESALEMFNGFTNTDALSLCTESTAPKFMKKMADTFFGIVEKNLELEFRPTARQSLIRQCLKLPHAQDFLLVIPIAGLGQVMHARMYRTLLCYRLSIPLHNPGEKCVSCGKLEIDIHGDHSIHCSKDVGPKYRHNGVRDTFADVCRRTGVQARKEAPLGTILANGGEARPADILIYGWQEGKHCAVDIVGSSPFTGPNAGDFEPGWNIQAAESRKKTKYVGTCSDLGYGFIPFSFCSLGGLGKPACDLLTRIERYAKGTATGSRISGFIFRRIAFSIQKGVGAQLVARLPTLAL